LAGAAPHVVQVTETAAVKHTPPRNPGKAGILTTIVCRKTLPIQVYVLFFPAIRVWRRFAAVFSPYSNAIFSTQEYRNMSKKGGAPTKSEVLTLISKDTGLSRKQVGSVFDSLGGVIKKSLRGNGLFTFPGLLKMKVVKRPATKARPGKNPFTGEDMIYKAKPASKKVRVLPLKSLKAMVN
jgi:nucleoid DNA-binding protein